MFPEQSVSKCQKFHYKAAAAAACEFLPLSAGQTADHIRKVFGSGSNDVKHASLALVLVSFSRQSIEPSVQYNR